MSDTSELSFRYFYRFPSPPCATGLKIFPECRPVCLPIPGNRPLAKLQAAFFVSHFSFWLEYAIILVRNVPVTFDRRPPPFVQFCPASIPTFSDTLSGAFGSHSTAFNGWRSLAHRVFTTRHPMMPIPGFAH